MPNNDDDDDFPSPVTVTQNECQHSQTSAEDTLFCEIFTIKCTEHIKVFFE